MPVLNIVYIKGADGNTAKVDATGHLMIDVTEMKGALSGLNVNTGASSTNISGQNVKEFGSAVRTGSLVTLESVSGGTELGSGAVFKVDVRSASGNAVIWIGGTGADAPNSGKGFELFGGEAKQIPVDNFNKIRLYPGISGQKVSYMGYA